MKYLREFKKEGNLFLDNLAVFSDHIVIDSFSLSGMRKPDTRNKGIVLLRHKGNLVSSELFREANLIQQQQPVRNNPRSETINGILIEKAIIKLFE
jgi:hypothetical protein